MDSFYLEKLHVWDFISKSKQIFLLVHREHMFFYYIYKETFYIQPINVLTDIDSILIGEVNKEKFNEVDADSST